MSRRIESLDENVVKAGLLAHYALNLQAGQGSARLADRRILLRSFELRLE
jgi:hypothetical protein